MKRFIKPDENLYIGFEVRPFSMPCTKDGMKDFIVEIRVYCQVCGPLSLHVEWAQIMVDAVSEQELIPQFDKLIKEVCQARKEVIQVFKDAKAGRITEEFFNNQEVDAEKF